MDHRMIYPLTHFQLGVVRGESVRRGAPDASDWAWLCAQGDDYEGARERPADAAEFAAGMASGCGALA